MKLLENSFFEEKFPSNIATFLNDKEASLDFGEEDTIYENPKISWAVKDHTDFVAKAPKMKSYSYSLNWMKKLKNYLIRFSEIYDKIA
jgi:hypothetical protein